MFESWLVISVSWALAAIFGFAVDHKLAARQRFTAALGAYRLFPPAVLPAAAIAVIVLELLTVCMLLLVTTIGAALAALLLSGYAAAIALNLARGRSHIDCGCGDEPTPISWWAVARNITLASAAIWAIPNHPVEIPAGLWQVLFCAATAAALFGIYRCIEELLNNLGRYQRLWLGADQ